MKQILRLPSRAVLKTLGLFVLLATLTLTSCRARLEVEDNSFEVSGKTTALGNVYINSDVPIEIQMYADAMKNVEVDVLFVSTEIQGALYSEDRKEIKLNDTFKYKFDKPLRLIFHPTVAMELGKLKLNVHGQEVVIDLQVNNPTHGLVFSKDQDTVVLGKNIPLQFSVVEDTKAQATAKTKSGGSTYKLTADMLEGKGILVVKDQTLFNTGTKTKADGGVELTKEEVTTAIFVPLEQGTNTIQFNITDSYGNTVNQTKTMDAEYAPLHLSFTATRDHAELNQALLYDMTLAMDGYTGGFNFLPTLLSGAGVFKIDGQAVSLVSPFKVAKTGVKKIIFEASKPGPVEIGFYVTDDFGGFVRDTLRGVIGDNSFTVTTTLAPTTEIKYTETIPFVVKIGQEAASADYTYEIKTNTPGVVVKKDNKIMDFGVSSTIKSGLHNYTFTGNACGNVVLTFKVTHATQEKSVVLDIPIKVSPNPLVVNLLNQSALTTRLNVPITVDLQFETGNAPVDLLYNIKPIIKTGTGIIYIPKEHLENKGEYYEGKKGTYQFTYTPTKLGTNTVEFEVYDSKIFGQRKTASFNVEVVHAEIVATPSASEIAATINANSGFNINVTEEDYKGDFRLMYSGGSGELKTNLGQVIEVSKNTVIKQGVTLLSYTPKTIGTETLIFAVTDDYLQVKTFNIKVVTTHIPMTFDADFAKDKAFLGRAVPVNITLSGAAPFTVKYEGGDGTMRRNGNVVTVAQTVTGNETWQYTPNTEGGHSLSFSAVDKNAQTKAASTILTASKAVVTASMSPATSSVVVRNAVNANLNVSNQAGDNGYTLTVSGSHNGTMNVTSGTKYTANNGVIGLTFTPNTIENHTFSITATDDYGQSATTSWAVNAVPAEIEASMTGTTAYINVPVEMSFKVSKPNYSSDYGISIRSSNGCSFSRTSFRCSNSTQSFTYTPTVVGSQTIFVDIDDSEGKTKTISANVQTAQPTFSIGIAEGEVFSEPTKAAKGILVNLGISQNGTYPAGSTFAVTLSGGGSYNSATEVISLYTHNCSWAGGNGPYGRSNPLTISVTDRYGKNITRTFYYHTQPIQFPSGGGGGSGSGGDTGGSDGGAGLGPEPPHGSGGNNDGKPETGIKP